MINHICVPFKNWDLDSQWPYVMVSFVFNVLRWEVIVCSADIVGMFDCHCSMSLFRTERRPKVNYICAIHMLCEVWFFTHILISLGDGGGGRRWLHRTSLTPPPYYDVPILGQKNERSCISVLWVLIFPFSTILLLVFGHVPTACYFWFFISSLVFYVLNQLLLFLHYWECFKFKVVYVDL